MNNIIVAVISTNNRKHCVKKLT